MKGYRILLVVVIGLLALWISPMPAAGQGSDAAKPVIIDTDMAVDDWMAILYLLQRPDVKVLAVTVSGTGEAHCDPGIQNTMNLLALAGNPDVPVACGRETPLKGTNVFPQPWREAVDVMNGLTLEANPNPPSKQSAVELLRETINGSSEKVTLVTLGPVTNIAELVQAEPAVAERIAMIYVMGGAVDVPGNVYENGNMTAEWNIYVDPVAVAQMVESGAPVTFVPLDATNHALLTMAFYDRLGKDRTTPEAEFVYQAVSSQIGFAESGGWYFWDPMAAVTATDERAVTIEDRTVRVITEEGPEFGRIKPEEGGQPVRVAVNADSSLFEQLFLNGLNGREASTPLPETAMTETEPAAPAMTPVENAADILGTWRFELADFHFQFREDGTYRANQTRAGLDSDTPEDVGTYTFKDGLLTLTSGATSRFCKEGNVGVYQLSFTEAGQLALVVQEDACGMRHPGSTLPQLFKSVE